MKKISTWRPAIEITQSEEDYKVKVQLPGVNADNIDVEVDNNIDLANFENIGNEFSKIGDTFSKGGKSGSEAVLAPLAMRLGATVTPYSNNWIELECPLNFTITDFDLISLGFLPTFGFSTGVEFTLKAGFFQLPLCQDQ